MKLSPRQSLIIFILLGLHAAIFLYANTRPIYWTHQEMLWHDFFWSMNSVNDFHLHKGFYFEDFLKPFYPYYVEAAFRLRQIAYFLDMISFKCWQLTGEVLLRNYALIMFHLINVVLVWRIIFYLTSQRATAWLSAALLLNSGIALATLLFPFRTAKLAVMTFFLIAWLALIRSPGPFYQSPLKHRVYFYAMILVTLLTDEVSYFFIPFLFLFLWIRDGVKGIVQPRLLLELFLTLCAYVALGIGIYFLVLSLPQQYMAWGIFPSAIKNLMGYYHNIGVVLSDLGKAFFGYFLRRNFGYWDLSLWGVLAGLSALGMLAVGCWRCSWVKLEYKVVGALVAIMAIKAFVFPHNTAVPRPPLMPEGTVFPALFFFSYYYTYAEAVLFAIVAGLFLNGALRTHKWAYVVLLAASLLMGFSSAIHLKDGPQDTLRFHLLWDPWRQKVAKDILRMETYLARRENVPVYASFESGEAPLARGRIVDTSPSRHAQYILLRHLVDIESGRLIISLKNITPPVVAGDVDNDELSKANIFIDVPTGFVRNLKAIREKYGEQALRPKIITTVQVRSLLVTQASASEVVFFIKGPAHFTIKANERKGASGDQYYGQSYQMFHLSFKDAGLQAPIFVNLAIESEKNKTAYLIGPFVL